MQQLFKMSLWVLFTLVMTVGLMASETVTADKAMKEMKEMKELKAQTVCPVTGEPINKKFFADYGKQRVFFSSEACIAKFKEAPEKMIAAMITKGEQPFTLVICDKCGEYKGTEKCCVEGAKICDKCGKHAGSPGCCIKTGAKDKLESKTTTKVLTDKEASSASKLESK